ncbi:MAG: hypothetical protein ACD_40C00126G0001 [uncultured bacterium]|nr:MAG: hypothetical protein ACD_40C00126G0001 [uncultured bacterium]
MSRSFFFPISHSTPVSTGRKLSRAQAKITPPTARIKSLASNFPSSLSFFTSGNLGNSSAAIIWNLALYELADTTRDSFSTFISTFPGESDAKNSLNIFAGIAATPTSITFATTKTRTPISRSVADNTSPSLFASKRKWESTGNCALVATALSTMESPLMSCSCNTSIFINVFLVLLLQTINH